MSWALMGMWTYHVLFLGATVYAFEIPATKPVGYVNDFATMLTDDEKQNLETTLANFQQTTSNEIVVVTLPTTEGVPIEMYANKLFRTWGIGDKDRNNGVLFLIARDDRHMRMEVGYGLEGAITDVLTKRIQDDIVAPFFKEGNYGAGIVQGTNALIQASQGEYTALPQKSEKSFPWQVVYFGAFFGASLLRALLAPTKSWWLGGVLGGLAGGIGGYIAGTLLWSGIGLLGGSLLGLGLDYMFSKSYQKRLENGSGDNGGPWSLGGSGGGFWGSLGGSGGGSGGGFGGFGGGSSGGGGSSSSW